MQDYCELGIDDSPTMTTENEFNSEDFQCPEFSMEVVTSFGKVELEAYNVGEGFVLEHPMITPTVVKNTSQLPNAIEVSIEKLEHSHDTMT